MNPPFVFQVAVATPLMQLFDYLPTAGDHPETQRGRRVLIPFGRTQRIGVIVGVRDKSDIAAAKLRCVIRVLDAAPLLDAHLMALLEWAAAYYQHPPGEVFATALPTLLRKGGETHRAGVACWRVTPDGRAADLEAIGKRARVQAGILTLLRNADAGLSKDDLDTTGSTWRRACSTLEEKGLVEAFLRDAPRVETGTGTSATAPQLTDAQHQAVASITASESFDAFLLEGVTGSGKTEVYLRCIQHQLDASRQSLVLVPEIGLTPQLVARFRTRLDTPVAVLHSGLNDTERLQAWCAARDGSAGVVIGTRSAVFVPLARPGLIVVDEEHDSSLKQQEGFRYSARDLAVWRAHRLDVPIVLGSATPSFESLENVQAGRYTRLVLPRRPGSARQPHIRLVDLRKQPSKDGLTEPLRDAIGRHLAADGQVLLYLNRRGFAPSLLCTACGELVECRRCDARMVVHQRRERLICHHCGAERPLPSVCEACDEPNLIPVGQGTERLEDALQRLYPQHAIVRIDRDTTRRRGEIGRKLEQVRSGVARILLGTQMLTKGHDFPNVTLVGIIDADQGLFGTDFRAGERLAQSFIQVAGRAGRGERPGEVYIQTLFPDHPLLKVLIANGYGHFATEAMTERRLAGWPPFAYLTLLRAEAPRRDAVFDFLDAARAISGELLGTDGGGIRMLGPAAAPMERRAGRYRGQLLVQADHRGRMQRFIANWRTRLDQLPAGRKTRWSIDVDPVELF